MNGSDLLDTGDPYFIAEAGVNHNGDLDTAERLIEVAADAGADAVKFQTFSADRLVSRDADVAEYQSERVEADTQQEMLKQYELGRAAHERLQRHARQCDITFLSTPFDPASAEMLADLGVDAIKLGSGELDNHPLLEHVAGLGLPMIVSTGMGTMKEVREARRVIRSIAPDRTVVFLHCTSSYPCEISEVNLRAMETMASELDEPVGYSDHTLAPETPALAVAAGATVVEKHFTLDSSMNGPDHEASLEPDELTRAVSLVDMAAASLGSRRKAPVDSERELRQKARKSIHAASPLDAGTELQRDHFECLRPADGLSPRHCEAIVGATLTQSVEQGDPISEPCVDIEPHANDSELPSSSGDTGGVN